MADLNRDRDGCWTVADLAGYLTGSWKLERLIVARSGLPMATSSGVATFVAVAGELTYHEEGELRLDGQRLPATRTLIYRLHDPARAAVHFDHGGHFHDLDLRDGRWRAEHLCGSDRYDGRFTVLDADRWQQEWTVTGPRKEHVITTSFTRCG